MVDVDEQNPVSHGNPAQGNRRVSLNQWLHRVVGVSHARVQSRLRGNCLHLLIEGDPCPPAEVVMPRLEKTLTAALCDRLLPASCLPLYQVAVYGRVLNRSKPNWSQSFYLTESHLPSAASSTDPPHTQPLANLATTSAAPIATSDIEPKLIEPEVTGLDRPEPVTQKASHLQDSQPQNSQPDSSAESRPRIPLPYGNVSTGHRSPLELAREGRPDAIAHYLSDRLSQFNLSVQARVEALPQNSAETDGTLQARVQSLKTTLQNPLTRLLIRCESAYSPDSTLLADPIAHHLRELELKNFRDAVVFGQVRGENRPEWRLRVDLTPPDRILREWARWGDVQAITRLLNRLLMPQNIEVSALLKDSTLHLTCQGLEATHPDKLTALATISPILESITPQGIQATSIYGVVSCGAIALASTSESSPPESSTPQSSIQTDSPLWVHWLDLPAKTQPTLALTTLELAQQGNLGAIAFLLTRLLNPNLDTKLSTGGVRVQVRHKDDLLHVMTDALLCPMQKPVGSAVIRFLKPLQIGSIAGVRIYGRRAGQQKPLWSYGADFASRAQIRLVPEVTPEFAVSDAYVGDLLSPPGALVRLDEAETEPEDRWRSYLERQLEGVVERLQRSLIATQLFSPLESTEPASTAESNQPSQQGALVAAVWGAVGLLLVVQSDWLFGRLLESALAPRSTTPPAHVSVAPTGASPSSAAPSASRNPASPGASVATNPVLLPKLSLQKPKSGARAGLNSEGFGRSSGGSAFNGSGFTKPGSAEEFADPAGSAPNAIAPSSSAVSLPASPPQPIPMLSLTEGPGAYPTFNSRQLDEKIALYRRYLKEHGTPDVLVIGSSRALRGLDPIALQTQLAAQGISGVKVFNFGINGATAQVVDLIVRQVLPQEALPKVIVWADGARAFNSGRLDVTYNGIVSSAGYRQLSAGKPPIPGTLLAQTTPPTPTSNSSRSTSVTEETPVSPLTAYQTFNQQLEQWLGSFSMAYGGRDRLKGVLRDHLVAWLPKGASPIEAGDLTNALSTDLSNSTSPAASAAPSTGVLGDGQGAIDQNGFLPLPNRFNPATYYQKYARVSGDYDSDYESFALAGGQMEALTSLSQFAQTRQISLVFVNLPLTIDYLDPTRRRHEEQFQQAMLQLAPQLGFTYRDLGQALVNQPEYFSDPSHLNRYGGYEVSRRLAQDVLIPWSQTRE